LLLKFKEFLFRHCHGDPVIVVSGLPRSGTSMAMRMLEAGGIPLLTDSLRVPDKDNPKGYFEIEKAKYLGVRNEKSWLKKARGKAVKIVSHLLHELPDNNTYQVLFMNRDLIEVIYSQNKMLVRRGEFVRGNDETVKTLFEKHLSSLEQWFKQKPNFSVLNMDYAEVIANPQRESLKIESFLYPSIDPEAMASVVDPTLYRNRVI